MKKHIFLSMAWPYMKKQIHFQEQIKKFFDERDYLLHTVEFQKNAQSSILDEVRNLMETCDGMLVLAFRRMEIQKARIRPGTDLDWKSDIYKKSEEICNKYTTSDWCNIEIGMAYGKKLPILLFLDDLLIKENIYMDEEIQIVKFNLEKDCGLESILSDKRLEAINMWEKRLKGGGNAL